VPFFQNNEFSQFTFVVSFKRYAGVDGVEPIIYNGGDPKISNFVPPSIHVYTANQREVVAVILTNTGAYVVISHAVVTILFMTIFSNAPL
jgi:hypothetical protein